MILRKPTVMLNDLANVFNNLEELDYEYIDAGSQIWVVDNFLPQHIFDEVIKENNNPVAWERDQLIKHPIPEVLRYENNKFYDMPVIEAVTNHLNSGKFMRWVEKLCDEDGLLPDPYIWGGGIVKMPRGKTITLHTDFTWNAKIRCEHFMNMALYLNEEWRPEWNGSLQFWNDDSTECLADVEIKPNRLIFWDNPTKVIHGFAEVLNCPENITRDVLMVFYYKSNNFPDEKPSKSVLNRKTI